MIFAGHVVVLQLLQDNIFCGARFLGFKIPSSEVPLWVWGQFRRTWL